ncbi:hypothetical protein ACFQ07_13615, partial [Actinomadura adrarensis]
RHADSSAASDAADLDAVPDELREAVRNDPFVRHIWDYEGADASTTVKEFAISGALTGRRLEARQNEQDARRRA